jgi:hypothetical protein
MHNATKVERFLWFRLQKAILRKRCNIKKKFFFWGTKAQLALVENVRVEETFLLHKFSTYTHLHYCENLA